MRVCDNCNGKLDTCAVVITFSYPSFMDGESHEFCTDKCALRWLTNNYAKKRLERAIEGAK